MGCGCGGSNPVRNPSSTLSSSGDFPASQKIIEQSFSTNEGQMVMLEYAGPIQETFTIRSRAVPGISYRFGNNQHHRMKAVLLEDAEFLTGLTGGDAKPLYRIVISGTSAGEHDPVSALGQPIMA